MLQKCQIFNMQGLSLSNLLHKVDDIVSEHLTLARMDRIFYFIFIFLQLLPETDHNTKLL